MSDQTTTPDVMEVNRLQRERIEELYAQRDALLEALKAVKRDFPDLHEWE